MGCGDNKPKAKDPRLKVDLNLAEVKNENEIEAKLVLLGDSGVGKSSIATRFSRDTFKEDYEVTIGGSYFQSQVTTNNGTSVKLHIWDTGGAERFRSMAHIYYKDAVAAILVYDVTIAQTLENIKFWMNDLSQYENPKNMVLGLAANKSDKTPEDQFVVPKGRKLAADNEMIFQETSALTAAGIKELFKGIAEAIVSKKDKDTLT